MSADRSQSRKFLGCLIKGPVGCFSFFVGATVVAVFFLPYTGGRHVAEAIEKAFDRTLAGTLELNDAWLLSFYGPQDGRLLLRDPSGREILRGTFGAPSLSEALDDDRYYGPLSLAVDYCEIVTGPDGVTNLQRALTPRGERGDFRIDLTSKDTKRVDVQVTIDHLLWRDETGVTTFEMRSFLGDATFRYEGGRAAAEFMGKGLVDGHPVGQLEARIFVPDLEALASGGGTGQFEIRLQGVDSRELGLVTGQGDAFVQGFGPSTDRFALVADRLQDQSVQVAVDVSSPLADLTLTGHLDRPTHRVVAKEGDRLHATFARRSGWSERLVSGLLPVIQEVRSSDSDDVVVLESTRFALPLHHDLAALDGVFSLELAPMGSYRIDERVFEHLPGDVALLHTSPTTLHVVVGVDAGVVRYQSVAIPLESGAIGVEGNYDLRSGAADLVLRLPSELGGDAQAVYRVVGPWGVADVVPTPPEPLPVAPR